MDFFPKLTSIINLVGPSAKRYLELKCVWEDKLVNQLASKEFQNERRVNQMHTLQRPGVTR